MNPSFGREGGREGGSKRGREGGREGEREGGGPSFHLSMLLSK